MYRLCSDEPKVNEDKILMQGKKHTPQNMINATNLHHSAIQ
uniref:Uncharacterized protein n=1 Tax=Anguilla anguilla TaxID=7936 RepID=A0A0E9WF57_ANGAN